jgi:SpoVK/Ycf46/Vps4 family AAA+-type ATPase
MASHRVRSTSAQSELSPLIRLWILRLLMTLSVHKKFIWADGFSDDTLAEALGLGSWMDSEARVFDSKAVRAELREKHQAAERQAVDCAAPPCLVNNIRRLRELVSLSETDCRILEFAVLIHSERILDDLADELGLLSTVKMLHVLSALLGIDEQEIRAALSSHGILAQAGLVSVERSGNAMLRGKLNLLSIKFADVIASSEADPVTLLRDTVTLASAPHLSLADYDHIDASLSVLQPYLKQSIATGRKGVNIYLHGASGTGKSQLAKALAQELGCELFEVASEDSDGDPVKGESRLRAFRAGQRFFSRRRALIVFDEVEDVFNDGDGLFGGKSTAQRRKAWMNRMLEENAVPTLWLSNSIQGIDPAFMRRFDMVFELKVPPKAQRARIIAAAVGDLIPAATITKIAEAESLAPAVVARAAGVVRSIREQLGSAEASAAFERLIDNTLTAQGHKKLSTFDPNRLPGVYDPAFINAGTDLVAVGAGLITAKSGRICLYGPPGTGKSAYARWLADQMGVPLIAKRGSDLLSMYVGGNEQNIARAFAEAREERAVLLIDEVDGFLQDRRGAERGWEVSLVNEMLTQMESFPGVFVASTNLMEGLDPAALRRFDLKVKFDFLRPGQAIELLRRHCVDSGLPAPSPIDERRVSGLRALTPGDFAAVRRQHRFRPVTSATACVAALEAECELKTGPKRAIGFY